ncbi:complement C1q-like protein 4 [Mizuhopecten yessoensis]|uniref:complement C1q-like protein 4 n=1 Tax=Mizuhopecten yessoensis TaxID=6573 RepID=UPI000B45D93F|nr:complement C1q-like protein 4 [Mizuhopecten yessoensis]
MICKAAVAFLACLVCAESFTPLNIPNYFPPPSRRAGGSSNTVVAFSAGLTNTTQSHVATNVTYDRVFVNGGNGYNNQTGVFKAPLGGTYVFMFHALSQSNQPLRLDLYHNLDYIATGYAHAVHDYATSSNAVVLTIDRGDAVYIQARGDNFVYGQPDEVYSTFNGFLLFPSNS